MGIVAFTYDKAVINKIFALEEKKGKTGCIFKDFNFYFRRNWFLRVMITN